jgi:hypothetical protein
LITVSGLRISWAISAASRPRGGELLVLAQRLLALEDAGVEPRVLEGDGGQRGQRGAEPFFVVVEPMHLTGEDRQRAQHLAFEHQRRGQHRAQAFVERQVVDVEVFGRLDIGELDLLAGVQGGGDGARLQRQVILATRPGMSPRLRIGERDQPQHIAGSVEHVETAGACLHDLAGVAGDGLEEFAFLHLGDQ